MNLFSLNDDVLGIIISHISPHDACQLTVTCRSGYSLAMPRFLSDVKFLCHSQTSATRIKRFCDFMLADPDTRIPCLRVLRIVGPAFALPQEESPYQCPCHFSRVLRQAIRLQELHLWSAGELLNASDCFVDALAALPSLDVVRLHGRPYACALLYRMVSHPHTVQLYSERPRWLPFTNFEGIHFPENLRPSLKNLRLEHCIQLAENLFHASVIFPSLQTLALTGYCSALGNIASAFPNLRRLHLQDVTFASGQPLAAWPSLHHIQTNGDLMVPLVTHVHRLELQLALNVPERLPLFLSLLERTTPTVLFCTIAHNRVADWLTELVRAAPGLKYIHIGLPSLDDTVITSCATALASLPLAALSMGFTSRLPCTRDTCLTASFACKVGSCIPSLRHVGLNVQGFSSALYADLDAITWFSVARREPCEEARAQQAVNVEQLAPWQEDEVLHALLTSTPESA